MTDITGTLRGYRITPAPPAPSQWGLEIEIDKEKYPGFTDSTISFAVLQSAILTYGQWKIMLAVDKGSNRINRIRVIDDRENICKADLPEQKPDQAYLPLQPTFFGDDAPPPKWGFFFAVKDKCKEYKGISIDVYAVIERAWRDKKTVVLTLDDNLIVGAKVATR
jgi:hypothetical protein